MVKRILRFSLIALVWLLIVATPAYAVSVTNALYVADLVTVNAGDATTNVSTVCDINTQSLIDGKYVTEDLLNTAVQAPGGTDIAYMPGVGDSDPWVFFVPSIGTSESKSYMFYAGGPAMQEGFMYFPESGGMTTDDDPSLELGNSFTIEQKGYVDTSAGSDKNLVFKGGAFRIYISAEGSITAEMLTTGSVNPDAAAGNVCLYNNNAVYATARSAATGTLRGTLSIGQSPPGATFQVERGFVQFDTSDIPDDAVITSAVLHLRGSQDASTDDFNIVIQSGMPTYPHSPLAVGDYDMTHYSGNYGQMNTADFIIGDNPITLTADGLDLINKVGTTKFCLRSDEDINNSAPANNELVNCTRANTTLTVNYSSASVAVTATGITSGVRKVVTTATGGGTNLLTIQVYDENDVLIDDDSAALGGASVPDNDNDWSFLTNGSAPYMDCHKIWVGGTLVQHIVYERDTTFDDLTEYNNDATPTFRTTSSDSDVSATFQNFSPISENECTAGGAEETPELLSGTAEMPKEFYGAEGGGTDHLPGAGLINSMLDAGGIPQDLFWIMSVYGLAAVAALVSFRFLKSMLWPALISGMIILVFALITWGNPIPLWSFFIYAVIAAGLLVSERVFGW